MQVLCFQVRVPRYVAGTVLGALYESDVLGLRWGNLLGPSLAAAQA